MRKAIDTDRLNLTRATARFLEDSSVRDNDGCLIFQNAGSRHVQVDLLRGGRGERTIVSVRRVAYAIAHPNSHVRADEDVTLTCGKVGDGPSGHGCCIDPRHLVKCPAGGHHDVRMRLGWSPALAVVL